VVIEYTSKTTRKEDQHTKFVLYRDTLKVKELFLFDPFGDYLQPQFQVSTAGDQICAHPPGRGRLPARSWACTWRRTAICCASMPLHGPVVPTPDEARTASRADKLRIEAARHRRGRPNSDRGGPATS